MKGLMSLSENSGEKRMKTGVFMSEDTREYYVAGMRKIYNADISDKKRESKPKRNFSFSRNTVTLIRNTAVCAFAVLLVWGVASSAADTEQTQSIREVVAYEYEEENIGELKFVSSVIDEVSTIEESFSEQPSEPAAFVYPVDGIVTTTFAQNGAGAIITALDTRDVVSSKDGEVYEVAENYIKILNSDGSITTYFGVSSEKTVGEDICAGNMIGELLSDVLYVEQDINGEKTDPFA